MYNNIEQLLSNPEWMSTVDASNFDQLALLIFQYQAQHNDIYKKYIEAIHIDAAAVKQVKDIPYLPIHFYKTHKVLSSDLTPVLHFESSGTTQTINAKHHVVAPSYYEKSFLLGFEQAYGHPEDYIIMGLLPNYLEKGNSSLVYMVDALIKKSKHEWSGFYLHDFDTLFEHLKVAQASGKKVLLFGVTFALLDFAERFPYDFSHLIIMETGGMKGRREEWTKQQVHEYLKERLQTQEIHSEYGMTELFSQGYSKSKEIFVPSSTLRISIREVNDPLSNHSQGKGAINIIDLANIHSCSFIATEDIGTVYEDGTFKIQGRLDQSALRGCSLLAL